MKNTAKPVTEVKFPAVTICASGFHMSNVEKKIGLNFQKWRNETNRRNNTEAEIKKDMEEYMRTTFQIEPQKDDQEPPNIMDILDTMVATNVEASVAANSVRDNVFACRGNNIERKSQGQKTLGQNLPREKRLAKKRETNVLASFIFIGRKYYLIIKSTFNASYFH